MKNFTAHTRGALAAVAMVVLAIATIVLNGSALVIIPAVLVLALSVAYVLNMAKDFSKDGYILCNTCKVVPTAA